MWNAGLDEAQAEIKIAGRNINNLRYADDTTPNAEIEEELKSLLLGRKVMTNLDSILNSREKRSIWTKVHLVKAMAFPVVIYGCESWTVKKAEHWRIDAFEW